MKDEASSVPINGFVGLKSKMNIFFTEDNYESKNAKDIDNNVIAGELKYKDYKKLICEMK